MSTLSVEQRLTVLEKELNELKESLASPGQGEPWWHGIVGVFQDDPAFEESARLGQEWRQSFQPHGDDPAPL